MPIKSVIIGFVKSKSPEIFNTLLNYNKKDNSKDEEKKYKKLLKKSKTSFDKTKYLSYLGEIYLLKGKLNKSKLYFQDCLKIEENNYRGLIGMANIAVKENNQNEAIRLFNVAVDKNKNIPIVYTQRGMFYYFQQKNYDLAEKDWKKAEEIKSFK